MTQMIFVNLPVADLSKSKAFYEAIGFANEGKFSDETAACMVLSDTIFVMLLTHPKWKTFTDKQLVDPKTHAQVALCISRDNRDAVDWITDTAGASGGVADCNPAQDHGFMYGRSFEDPDGHVWEPMWMDPAMAETGPPAEAMAN